MDFYIQAKRITSESRRFKISVFDKTVNIHSNTIYKIVRHRISDIGNTLIQEIKPSIASSNYTVKVVGDYTIMELTDTADKYGSEYLYRAIKEEDLALIDATDFVSEKSLPSKVNNLQIINNKCSYDVNNVPTKLALQWDAIDTLNDNINARGYIIYYSLADRGANNWDLWKPIRGTSTGNSVSTINVIDKTLGEIIIDVPQVSDYMSPKDIRLAIVSVTSGVPQLQSRYSNVVSFLLKNVITTLVKAGQSGAIELLVENVTTRPVSITIPQGTFAEDAVLLFSKSTANPQLGSYQEEYTYNFKANKSSTKPIGVAVDIDMYYGQKFEVRLLNPTTNKWVQTPATYNTDTKKINFTMSQVTNFVILIPEHSASAKSYSYGFNSLRGDGDLWLEQKFNHYTGILINKLPTWSKVRRNPTESIGAYFLHVTGLELEDVNFILNYAYKQAHIDTADVSQVDIVYKARMPVTMKYDDKVVAGVEGFSLVNTNTLEEFFLSPTIRERTPEIAYDNQYIVDYQDKLLYVKKPYNADTDNPYGIISVSIFRPSEDEPYYTFDAPLQIHHVWNFFDEFGMLLNTPRLLGETNAEYKERILDVFKNKSSSTREGLLNGIARELSIRKNAIWYDTTKDFIIKDPMVVLNAIKVNGELVPLNRIYYTSKNYIVIKPPTEPLETKLKPESQVTYVTGIEMHTFHNRKDTAFVQQLYNIDGTATDLFKHYVKSIKEKIPVEWGQFKWNEGYWDIADANMSGYGFLPSLLDGKFTGFRNYKSK